MKKFICVVMFSLVAFMGVAGAYGDEPDSEDAIRIIREQQRAYNEAAANIASSYNSAYNSPGCYVASAVYGSYDCPEVWTLRRFRDNYLATSMPGRAFIKTYYTVSPSFVAVFGKTELFNAVFKKALDSFVSTLQEKGIESLPYIDPSYI